MQGFLGAGPSCTSSPSGQGNGVALEAVRHEGGHRAPEVVAVEPVEDSLSVPHSRSAGRAKPCLVQLTPHGGKSMCYACTFLKSDPSLACLMTPAFCLSVPNSPMPANGGFSVLPRPAASSKQPLKGLILITEFLAYCSGLLLTSSYF